jgi:hypothetical protein
MTGVGTLLWALPLLLPTALAGWALLTLLAPPGLPSDARLALCPVVGVAAFSAAFAVGIPLLPARAALVLATLCVLSAVPVALLRSRRLPQISRPQLAAAAIACIAIVPASVPALAHDTGAAATWGNADPYLWVSQAKSMLDGPPPAPATRFPDRVAYEHVTVGGWAPALPAFVALAALSTHRDPVDAFAIVVAALYVLTPLTIFAMARTALGWTPRLSFVAATVVALSPYQLYAAYYGWLPQIAAVACVLAAALAFRLALGADGAQVRLTSLAAVFVAGALGIYRLPFLPYLVFILSVVTLGYLLQNRHMLRPASANAAKQAALLAAGSLVLVIPSAFSFAAHASTFWSRQTGMDSWQRYVRALPSDALGLTPRFPDLGRSVFLGWQLLALVLAAALLIAGTLALRRTAARCADLVLSIVVASVLAVAVAQLPLFTPYFSIKLMGYAAAPMILVALAPLSGQRSLRPTMAVSALIVAASLAIVLVAGFRTKTAAALAPISAGTARIDSSSTVEIESRSTWEQMWTIYFTREHPASVPHPSDFLTGLGLSRPAAQYRHMCPRSTKSSSLIGLRGGQTVGLRVCGIS